MHKSRRSLCIAERRLDRVGDVGGVGWGEGRVRTGLERSGRGTCHLTEMGLEEMQGINSSKQQPGLCISELPMPVYFQR